MLKCITIAPISTVVSVVQTRRPIHNALVSVVQTRRPIHNAHKNLKESTSTSHTEAIGVLNNDTRGSYTISKLGVDASRMLIGSYRPRSGSINWSVMP